MQLNMHNIKISYLIRESRASGDEKMKIQK